jgi:hypothetical protein
MIPHSVPKTKNELRRISGRLCASVAIDTEFEHRPESKLSDATKAERNSTAPSKGRESNNFRGQNNGSGGAG